MNLPEHSLQCIECSTSSCSLIRSLTDRNPTRLKPSLHSRQFLTLSITCLALDTGNSDFIRPNSSDSEPGPEKCLASWERRFPRATFLANQLYLTHFLLPRYSSYSYSWPDIVLNPTLTPFTHPTIQLEKSQMINKERYILNKSCTYS